MTGDEFEVDMTDEMTCPYCGAIAGLPCHTVDGRTTRTHAGRIVIVTKE